MLAENFDLHFIGVDFSDALIQLIFQVERASDCLEWST